MNHGDLIIEGLRMHYVFRNENEDHVLFFIHGNSGSHRSWTKQMSGDAFATYGLVAPDLPGHGSSQAAAHPQQEYSPSRTAKLLAEFIVTIAKARPYALVGFSYGTNLVAELVNLGLDPAGIVLISPCLVGGEIGLSQLGMDVNSIYLRNDVSDEEARSFYNRHLQTKDTELINREDYFSTDTQFRPVLLQCAIQGIFSDEIKALQVKKLPMLVIWGSEDSLVDPTYLDHTLLPLWKDKMHIFYQTGHFLHQERAGLVNNLLEEYLEDMFKASHS